MRNGDDFSPAVIERIATLLDEVGAGQRLTLSELAERAHLPRSSVHRLLAQLLECGWVMREGNTYGLSRAMIGWGARAQQTDRLFRAAHSVLHELHASTGLVAHLAVLEGPDVRYLDKVGRSPIALPSRVGGRQPALRTALGRALIAHASALQGGGDLLRHLPGDSPAMRREVARVRQEHVAYEAEQCAPGVACLAAPIGDQHACVAAISLAGPIGAVDPAALTLPVRRAAYTIWTTLGGDQRTSA